MGNRCSSRYSPLDEKKNDAPVADEAAGATPRGTPAQERWRDALMKRESLAEDPADDEDADSPECTRLCNRLVCACCLAMAALIVVGAYVEDQEKYAAMHSSDGPWVPFTLCPLDDASGMFGSLGPVAPGDACPRPASIGQQAEQHVGLPYPGYEAPLPKVPWFMSYTLGVLHPPAAEGSLEVALLSEDGNPLVALNVTLRAEAAGNAGGGIAGSGAFGPAHRRRASSLASPAARRLLKGGSYGYSSFSTSSTDMYGTRSYGYGGASSYYGRTPGGASPYLGASPRYDHAPRLHPGVTFIVLNNHHHHHGYYDQGAGGGYGSASYAGFAPDDGSAEGCLASGDCVEQTATADLVLDEVLLAVNPRPRNWPLTLELRRANVRGVPPACGESQASSTSCSMTLYVSMGIKPTSSVVSRGTDA